MSWCFHLATHSPRTHFKWKSRFLVHITARTHIFDLLLPIFFSPFHQNICNEKKPALRFNVWRTLFKLIKSNLIDGIVYIFVEYMFNVNITCVYLYHSIFHSFLGFNFNPMLKSKFYSFRKLVISQQTLNQH